MDKSSFSSSSSPSSPSTKAYRAPYVSEVGKDGEEVGRDSHKAASEPESRDEEIDSDDETLSIGQMTPHSTGTESAELLSIGDTIGDKETAHDRLASARKKGKVSLKSDGDRTEEGTENQEDSTGTPPSSAASSSVLPANRIHIARNVVAPGGLISVSGGGRIRVTDNVVSSGASILVGGALDPELLAALLRR